MVNLSSPSESSRWPLPWPECSPKLGTTLAAAIRTPNEWWTPPLRVTLALSDLAAAALPEWDALLRPARIGPVDRVGTRGHWLVQLGLLTLGTKATMTEHMQRLALMAGGLMQPTFCFSLVSLYDAARRFRFFPTFGEAAIFLDEIAEPARRERRRLGLIAAWRRPRTRPTASTGERIAFVPALTREERVAFIAEMRALRQKLEQSGIGDTDRAATARRQIDEVNARMRARAQGQIADARQALIGTGALIGNDGAAFMGEKTNHDK